VAALRPLVLGPAKPAPEPAKPPEGAAPTRIALVTAEKGDPIQTLLTLAEAKMAEGKALDVLDRQTIDKVLAGHKLPRAGLVAAGQALAVGKLLSVELLAVLETAPGEKKATGLVVFDARTGVKLWDAGLPARLSQAVEATVEGVEAAQRKHLLKF